MLQISESQGRPVDICSGLKVFLLASCVLFLIISAAQAAIPLTTHHQGLVKVNGLPATRGIVGDVDGALTATLLNLEQLTSHAKLNSHLEGIGQDTSYAGESVS